MKKILFTAFICMLGLVACDDTDNNQPQTLSFTGGGPYLEILGNTGDLAAVKAVVNPDAGRLVLRAAGYSDTQGFAINLLPTSFNTTFLSPRKMMESLIEVLLPSNVVISDHEADMVRCVLQGFSSSDTYLDEDLSLEYRSTEKNIMIYFLYSDRDLRITGDFEYGQKKYEFDLKMVFGWNYISVTVTPAVDAILENVKFETGSPRNVDLKWYFSYMPA